MAHLEERREREKLIVSARKEGKRGGTQDGSFLVFGDRIHHLLLGGEGMPRERENRRR